MKKSLIFLSLLFVICTYFIFNWANSKITYMEFISFDDNINSFVVLDKKDDMLSQDFTSPYEILNRIEVRIDNPNGVDTSNW